MTLFNQLGPYRIVREIGRGGMAVVFLAVDTRNNREVALKTVPQGYDREAREACEAEQMGAELQLRFSAVSSRVPAVYEHAIDDSGYFYVAMEYLDGENLSDVVHRGPLAIDRGVSVARELCCFLEEAQRFEVTVSGRSLRSLLHGDLKPRNVRITSTGKVKVLDFGIAKALSLSRKVTRNDFGSVAYLSPERLESGEVDTQVDYWAVGVLLYEMLSGVAPYQATDTRRLEQKILSRQAPDSLAHRCPAALEAVIKKLLAPTPAERYADASAIREDLERFTATGTTLAAAGAQSKDVAVVALATGGTTEATRKTSAGGPESPPLRLSEPVVDDMTRRTHLESEATRRTGPGRPEGRPLLPTAEVSAAASVVPVAVKRSRSSRMADASA